ncbi:hypothetical protein Vretifemale_513 [Volvox reticuliferus]|nr:hypothetical protein Vretifemale_513 [Volvox reticuliferus]
MDYAADLSQLSGPWSQEDYNWGNGPDALPSRGYSTLVSYLATNQTIWTNYAVDFINYSNPALVDVRGRILKGTGQGSTFVLLAKGVINTMPLGYLQAQLAPATPTLFKPALATSQSAAIKAMGMGLLNKVILVWPNSSWWSGIITTPWLTIRNSTSLGSFSEYYNLAATGVRDCVRLNGDNEKRLAASEVVYVLRKINLCSSYPITALASAFQHHSFVLSKHMCAHGRQHTPSIDSFIHPL